MRLNPMLMEVLSGLTRQGKAQLDYLALLVVQAVVLFLWWPKHGVAQMLESEHGPDTLTAVVVAFGATTAYHAVRAGAEEFLLSGQHGLRDWALATPLRLRRVIAGYVSGHLVHHLHLLALSAPFLLMAFTVSGGEWIPLGWCLAAALVQALCYRLGGAIAHLAIGHHPAECHFVVRAIVVVPYVLIGWLVPLTSHVALTAHLLGERPDTQPVLAGMPAHWAFLALYAALCLLALTVLCLLLTRSRRRTAAGAVHEAVMP